MIDGPAVSSGDNVTVSFNNNLRNASYSNNVFYKTLNQNSINVNTIERNRIWLDLINSTGETDRTLLGYIQNATMNQDSFYDCVTQNTGGTMIYSLIGDTKFSIQGRSLPFDENDEVPIGFNVHTQGSYSIAIAALDGLFENNTQNIYLEDTYLNVIQNLKQGPYTFNSVVGNFNDRFKLRFTNNNLSNTINSTENSWALISDSTIKVQSSEDIEEIMIYDVSGKLVKKYYFETSKNTFEDNFPYAKGFYITTIKLKNDTVISKKLLY